MKKILAILLSFMFLLSPALGFESAFDEGKTLSPEDEQAAKDYIHKGKTQKKYDEMCDEGRGGYSDICTNNRTAFEEGSSMAKLEQLMPVVLKAYSLIMSFTQLKGAKGEDGSDGENKPDYCAMLAGAGEAAGSLYMQTKNQTDKNNFQNTPSQTKQAASFYTLAKAQKNMAKTSKVQAGTWAAVGACYGVMLATKSISGDWKVYAKLAASVLIAGFYLKKAKAHKERAKILEQMAKDLPQKGDCNPFTDTTCFCYEDSSASSDPTNYQKFCIPRPLLARSKNNDAFVCADKDGKADLECKCKKTDSCIDKTLKVGAIKLGANPTLLKDPLASLRPISQGLGTGNLAEPTRRNLAFANSKLKEFKEPADLKNKIKLNKDQVALAKTIAKTGIPNGLAAAIAAQKPGAIPASLNNNLKSGNLLGDDGKRNAFKNKNKFVRGKNAPTKRSSKSNSRRRKRRSKKSNASILDFAEKAAREAEIVKDSSKGIFDIISYRYKMSAWNTLEVDPEEIKN